MTQETTAPTIDDLRDKDGKFSMLAIDQRESLRQMLASAATIATVEDGALEAFKLSVVRELSPFASAVLLDHSYGSIAAKSSSCPVILAADVLFQAAPGGPVNRAELDPLVTPELLTKLGASALKMLVPWLPDQRAEAIALSASFMDLCRKAGVPGIVEGVVRPDDLATWSEEKRNDALVLATEDLAQTMPDLYKAEVPQYGGGDPDGIIKTAQRITDILDCPWVVLSSGVPAAIFPNAVALSMRGGAGGFLAGRAIWADAITAEDPQAFLRNESAGRMRDIASIARNN